MKLTIFAETGGIGRQVPEQAVAAGHNVTAVVRNLKKLSRQIRIVTADLAAALWGKVDGVCKARDGYSRRSPPPRSYFRPMSLHPVSRYVCW